MYIFPLICSKKQLYLFLIGLMFEWAKITLFKLSLRSDFKALWQSTSVWSDPYLSKSIMAKLQSELLPSNCYSKPFEICCRKLVLRILAPLLFKWAWLLCRWFVLIFLPSLIRKMFFLFYLHISVKFLLTTFHLLFKSGLSVLNIISQIITLRFSDFNLFSNMNIFCCSFI